jgi:hypothetical protein
MKCRGLHCDGCGDGAGGAAGLAVVALLVIIIAAAVKERHAITVAVEIVGSVLAITAAGTVAGLFGYGVWRVRQHVLKVRDRRISPQVRAVITDVRAGRLTSGQITPGNAIGARRAAAGQLEPPSRVPGQSWTPPGTTRFPELIYARVLIGDADREWLIATLREHYAAGRLNLDDLSRRVTVVLSARYVNEAAAALAELPRIPRGATGGER